jgi:hypothetical protein
MKSKARESDDSVQMFGDKNQNIRGQTGAQFSYQYTIQLIAARPEKAFECVCYLLANFVVTLTVASSINIRPRHV